MKGRRRSDKLVEPFVVTTEDGMRFRCSVAALGRESDPRWVLLDSDGAQYVGPSVEPDKSHEAVEKLIRDWWRGMKAEHEQPPATQQETPTAQPEAAPATQDT